MIAFSATPTFQVYLPAGRGVDSLVDMTVSIRDQLGSETEWTLNSIVVRSDLAQLYNIMQNLPQLVSGSSDNILIELLAIGNQNSVTQLIYSLGAQINQLTEQSLNSLLAREPTS
jgi:hypothetical protein